MMIVNASLDASASSSFTALLELPPTQVVKLLHDDDDDATVTATTIDSLLIDPIASNLNYDHQRLDYLSVATEQLLEMELPKPVVEKKVPEKRKKKVTKKIKEEEEGVENEEDEEEEVGRGSRSSKRSKKEDSPSQLPYVHVRARRGQATDSHSLAERARREKINARMKLLQELVPGCSKISGIALVLDEIINHVQALQLQVEFLSMQLAAVNPRIEFNLDHIMDEENDFVGGSFLSMHPPFEWSDPQVQGMIGFKQSLGQQFQCNAYQQPQGFKEDYQFESSSMPGATHLSNNSTPDTGTNELSSRMYATAATKSGAGGINHKQAHTSGCKELPSPMIQSNSW